MRRQPPYEADDPPQAPKLSDKPQPQTPIKPCGCWAGVSCEHSRLRSDAAYREMLLQRIRRLFARGDIAFSQTLEDELRKMLAPYECVCDAIPPAQPCGPKCRFPYTDSPGIRGRESTST